MLIDLLVNGLDNSKSVVKTFAMVVLLTYCKKGKKKFFFLLSKEKKTKKKKYNKDIHQQIGNQ